MVQEQDGVFCELIGKNVKAIYQDLGKPHFARGILKKTDSSFLYIVGDYSQQIIPIKSIIKINSVKKVMDQEGLL